jgi:hypothetical protein
MIGSAGFDHKLVLTPMRTPDSRRGVVHDLALSPSHIRSPALVASLPTAQSDDLVVLRPVCKGVVGGVHNHHAAAATHVIDKCLAHLGRPEVAVVVADQQVKITELWTPSLPLGKDFTLVFSLPLAPFRKPSLVIRAVLRRGVGTRITGARRGPGWRGGDLGREASALLEDGRCCLRAGAVPRWCRRRA